MSSEFTRSSSNKIWASLQANFVLPVRFIAMAGCNDTSSMAPLFLAFVLLGIISSSLTAIAQVPSPSGGFSLSGSLGDARVAHTATLLTDGRVLVVGGGQGPDLIDGFWVVSGAELFDPATASFASAGISAHDFHTATLLLSGQVLIAGGESPVFTPTAAADLYDPIAGSFQQTGNMVMATEQHTATLLQDGRVLIAGGAGPNGFNWESLLFAEIYDPATGTFSVTGSLNEPRFGHTATLLSDGRVLVTGGWSTSSLREVASAEIYDPVTGLFTYTGSMNVPRSAHTATLLVNGQVLMSGGSSNSTIAEVYDPATGLFQTVSNMTIPRIWHSATRLADGTVLIAGGWVFPGSFSSAEIYNPASGLFTRTADMNFDRIMHTATLLDDGRILVIGGAGVQNNNLHLNLVNTAEVYKTCNASRPISASPNPCTLSGSLCTSYIQWTTTGISNAQVWMRVGNGPEYLFANAGSCLGTHCPAPWVGGGGAVYTFTLYDCSSVMCTETNHRNAPVLGSVRVTAH